MSFFLFEAEARGVEYIGNEIKDVNFVQQAKDKNIITFIPNCTIKNFGWLGDITIDPKDTNHLKTVYLNLYDYLVKHNIIIKKFDLTFFFTADFSYKITQNKELLEIKNLEKILNKQNNDFPKVLKCYTIDYDKLSHLLKNYNNNPTNEVKVLTTGGGKKISNKKISNKKISKINKKNKKSYKSQK